MKRQLKLENNCFVDYFLNMDDVKSAIENNITLTGKVMYIDELNQNVIVRLGADVLGIMPWNEATMYPLTNKYRHCSCKLWELRPDQISALDGKKIRVKVKDITSKGVILSRKANMIEAWEHIKKMPNNTIVPASVNGIHKENKGVFFDIGEGITTFCLFKEYTATRGVLGEWVKFGDMSNIRIFNISDEKMRIDCSRKMACSQKHGYNSFHKYSIVDVKIASPAYNKHCFCGYHVEVNPIVTGIADSPYIPRNIQLGETVQAVIRKVMVKERKMSLIIL